MSPLCLNIVKVSTQRRPPSDGGDQDGPPREPTAPAATPPKAPGLNRDRVVRTALALLDETGLDGLTLRVLADRLGVKAPALYWHVPSKAALLDEMATTMLRDLLAAGDWPGGTWQELMTTAAGGLRAMMLARRDGARVLAGTYITDDEVIAATELPLRVLTAAGFGLGDAVMAWQAMYCYVVGFAIEEQGVRLPGGQDDPRFAADRRRTRLDPGESPLATDASSVMFADPDTRFTFGLRALITGFEAVLAADRPAAQPPVRR